MEHLQLSLIYIEKFPSGSVRKVKPHSSGSPETVPKSQNNKIKPPFNSLCVSAFSLALVVILKEGNRALRVARWQLSALP